MEGKLGDRDPTPVGISDSRYFTITQKIKKNTTSDPTCTVCRCPPEELGSTPSWEPETACPGCVSPPRTPPRSPAPSGSGRSRRGPASVHHLHSPPRSPHRCHQTLLEDGLGCAHYRSCLENYLPRLGSLSSCHTRCPPPPKELSGKFLLGRWRLPAAPRGAAGGQSANHCCSAPSE